MALDKATATKRAALLMLILGVDASVAVSKRLEQSVAYDIMREAAKIKALDPEEAKDVLRTLLKELPDVRRAPSGKRFAAEVLKQSFGEDQASSIDFLKRLDRMQLEDIVATEHPQVAAFVMSYVHPETASLLMSGLEPDRQLDIARRIARSETPQREGIKHLVRSLSNRLNFLGADRVGEEEIGGIESLVNIMKGVGREVEQNILHGFETVEPELADELKKNMFVFDDLVLLDDRSMQKLLKEVDGKILALSLKRAPAAISDLILRNLSERARKILQEDMEAMGKVRVRDVDQAQTAMVAAVRRLEESGEIQLTREDEKFV